MKIKKSEKVIYVMRNPRSLKNTFAHPNIILNDFNNITVKPLYLLIQNTVIIYLIYFYL